jgi:signal transduction histidine kinase
MHETRTLRPAAAPPTAAGARRPDEGGEGAQTAEASAGRTAGGTTSAAPAFEVFVYRLPLQGAQSAVDSSASDFPAVLQERPQSRPALAEPGCIEPLLRQNAVWFCQLRWLVIAVLGATGFAGCFPEVLGAFGVVIAPTWPFAVAGLLVGFNLVFIAQTRRTGLQAQSTPVRRLLWTQIVADLLVLTAVIHWLGSGLPAAPFMYLFHIVLACMVFSPRESLGVAGLAATFFLLCLLLESVGVLGRPSVLARAAAADGVGSPSLAYTVAPVLLTWFVIWYLVSRLASALRSRDRELYVANRRLKASIEERSKHMLQTTHQLKAPFAAIHAQTQLLLGNYCGTLPDAARTVTERISARCLVLARQIQEMLQLANLRSHGQTAPPRKALNLGALVEEMISRIEPAARQRGVRIDKDIQPVVVEGVEDHLTMVVDNLVVNAVNYSFDGGVVDITCRGRDPREAVLVVRDHGIGIPEAKLPRIFDDYYRTEEAVQHNRSSTGLGLAIVREVACENRWPITVESAPGWGTRMTVAFPALAVSRGFRAAAPASAVEHREPAALDGPPLPRRTENPRPAIQP